jgi:hypothetical protein
MQMNLILYSECDQSILQQTHLDSLRISEVSPSQDDADLDRASDEETE